MRSISTIIGAWGTDTQRAPPTSMAQCKESYTVDDLSISVESALRALNVTLRRLCSRSRTHMTADLRPRQGVTQFVTRLVQ
eukprot:1176598-Prymnesium_polylepis.2